MIEYKTLLDELKKDLECQRHSFNSMISDANNELQRGYRQGSRDAYQYVLDLIQSLKEQLL